MSDLPRERLSYETVVGEYFLGLRGAGLMLSPLDLEQLRSWERRGLPVAVVCRGLRRGFEDALRRSASERPPPRSVRAYRLAVEDEWRAYREGRVGDAPPPPDERVAAGRRLAAATDEEGLERVDAALLAADAALVRGWLAALGRPERAALGTRCRLRAGPRMPSTRPAAYRAALRAHLVDAAREAGLLCLRGSV